MCYLIYNPEFSNYAILNSYTKKWRGWFSNLSEWDSKYLYILDDTRTIKEICIMNNYEIIYQHGYITKELLKSKLPELFI